MQSDRRVDITPKPAEFDYRAAAGRGLRVTVGELVAAVVGLTALLAVVVSIDDRMTRLAGVLLITGALSAYIAREVDATRTAP